MREDLRSAVRQLRRHWGFSLTTVLVLGLGIGVATAMFSVLSAVLLRPLPYPHPDQLVLAAGVGGPNSVYQGASQPDAQDWQRRSRAFSALAYYQGQGATVRIGGLSSLDAIVTASGNLFATLEVAPHLGRTFNRRDARARARVAVLSHHLWRNEFHSSRTALGQVIQVSGNDYAVIGVMPAGFGFPWKTDLWIPCQPPKAAAGMSAMAMPSKSDAEDMRRQAQNFAVIARLRPSETMAAAASELSVIQSGIARRYAGLGLPTRVRVASYRESLSAELRPVLLDLSGAVALVWLLACAAVGGLLLTRFVARGREFAVRASLGAGRLRLARQLLAESLLLGAAGGVCGGGLAWFALTLLRPFLAPHLPSALALRANWVVFAGLAGTTLLTVVLAGGTMAWVAAGAAGMEGLRGGSTATPGRSHLRLRDMLVVGEIALALVLLCGAGLLLRTLYKLDQVPLGFRTGHILTASVRIPAGRFDKLDIRTTFDLPLLARLDALPGVYSAALSSIVPLNAAQMSVMSFSEPGAKGMAMNSPLHAAVRFISPGYATLYSIPLLRGRYFSAGLDAPNSPRTVLVNEAFAAKFFPRQNPVGKYLFGAHGITIVGELANVRNRAVAQAPAPVMYFSTSQLRLGGGFYGVSSELREVAIRAAVPPESLVPAVRAALHAVTPDLALSGVATMQERVRTSIGDQLFAARLLGMFALAALIIACAGLYSLLAFAVSQRTREIGIRMALGADQHAIAALVLRRALWLLLAGVLLGLLLAFELVQLAAAYLYQVPARDPLTMAAVALLLLGAGLAAAWLPARRAAGVSPTVALHAE